MESTVTTDADGNKRWRNAVGKLHRTDGPAVEYTSGGKVWYLNGKRHRTDGPAAVWAAGGKEWYLNGQCHRTDGPAVEYVDGDPAWWVDGKWLGNGAEGFWTLWDRLSDQQRMDLNVQLWAAKYTEGN